MAEFWENDPPVESDEGKFWEKDPPLHAQHSEEPWKQDPPLSPESSGVGAAVRGALRSVVPVTAGALGGIGAGAVGGLVGNVPGAIAGGVLGAGAASYAAREVQDSIVDKLGLDSPEQRAADAGQHPYITGAAELVPALATLSPGAVGTASERLAQRLASGAILGTIDVVNQGLSTGKIDPIQTLIAGAGGAALPSARPWAEKVGTLGGRLGARVTAPAKENPPAEAAAAAQPKGESVGEAPPGVEAALQSAANLRSSQGRNEVPNPVPSAPAGNVALPRDPAGNAGRPNYLPEDPITAASEIRDATVVASRDATSPTRGTAGTPAAPIGGARDQGLNEGNAWYGKGPDPRGGFKADLFQDQTPSQPIERVQNLQDAAEIKATFAQKPPLPGPDVNQGPAEHQEPTQLAPGFPTWRPQGPQPGSMPSLITPSRENVPLNKSNFGARGERGFTPRFPGQNIRLEKTVPERLRQWNQGQDEGLTPGQEGQASPPVGPPETPAAVAQPLPPQSPERPSPPSPSGKEIPEDLSIPPFLRRQPVTPEEVPAREGSQAAPEKIPAQEPENQNFGGRGAGGQKENINIRQPKMAPKPFEGMIENKEAYEQAARDRAEEGNNSTVRVYDTLAQQEAEQGRTVKEANARRGAQEEQYGQAFDAATKDIEGITPEMRQDAIRRMIDHQQEPLDALDAASGAAEREAITAHEGPEMHSLGAAARGPVDIAVGKSKVLGALKDVTDKLGHWWNRSLNAEALTEKTKQMGALFAQAKGRVAQASRYSNEDLLEFRRAVNQNSDANERNQMSANFQKGTIPKDSRLAPFAEAVYKDNLRYDRRLDKADEGGYWRRAMLPRLFEDPIAAADEIKGRYDEEKAAAKKNKQPFNPTVPTVGDLMATGLKVAKQYRLNDGSVDPTKLIASLHHSYDSFLVNKHAIDRGLRDTGDWAGLFSLTDRGGDVKLDDMYHKGVPVYAEPDIAMMFNRFVNHQKALDPTTKSFLNTMQKITNAGVQWQLALGAYHAVNETQEAYQHMVKLIANQAISGRFPEAMQNLKELPAAPYLLAKKDGKIFMDNYFNKLGSTPEGKQMVGELRDAGVTPGGISAVRTPDLGSAPRGFFEAWKEGALNKDFTEGLHGGFGKKMQLLGQVMHSTMEPLFNIYIPHLKMGAIVSEYAQFKAANPGMSRAEYVKAARDIRKSVDDRFGELDQSLLFWNNELKRAANLTMISPGWFVGTIRSLIGGAGSAIKNPRSMGIASGEAYRPNAVYPLAFAITTGLVGSIYQFLKTGQPPTDFKDPFFPKTGGQAIRSNLPERAILPGYLKDVYEWWHIMSAPEGSTRAASQAAYNKLSLVPRTTWDTLANKDWAGHQIYNPNDPLHQKVREYFSYLAHNAQPIFASTVKQNAQNEKGRISTVEALGGVRHAPTAIEKPEQSAAGAFKRNAREAAEAHRFRRRQGLE